MGVDEPLRERRALESVAGTSRAEAEENLEDEREIKGDDPPKAPEGKILFEVEDIEPELTGYGAVLLWMTDGAVPVPIMMGVVLTLLVKGEVLVLIVGKEKLDETDGRLLEPVFFKEAVRAIPDDPVRAGNVVGIEVPVLNG